MKRQKIDDCLRLVLQKNTTEQLDALLQAELRKDAPGEELVLTIMDIIQEREASQPAKISDTVLSSWGHYKEQCDADHQAARSAAIRRGLTKTLAGALAACLLIFAVPRVFGAENIFQLIACWTDSEFSFSNQDEDPDKFVFKTDNPGLQRIYDTVTDLGVTDPVVPMWVPDGFELVELDVSEQMAVKKVYARLESDVGGITFSAKVCDKAKSSSYSKDETYVMRYERGGVDHYIISNDGEWKAVWTQGNCECSIATDGREETLYEILSSIY